MVSFQATENRGRTPGISMVLRKNRWFYQKSSGVTDGLSHKIELFTFFGPTKCVILILEPQTDTIQPCPRIWLTNK